ncbi:MAG: glutamate racemase [Lachnospiraceae bacterium]|nr:glutamate racemase [Lachnospiraceae bacterium]HBV83837.1 glutamate racemase [Lachnospiraceae bacterium]
MNIGIFDSGIGGLTLLHQAIMLMPQENFLFYADTDHVPYGTKSREQVISYVDEVIRFMISHDCKAVVIACNTATAVAAELMRDRYDCIPIIGIEPAVKPAVEESAGKRVMVVATPLTVHEKKLKKLVERVDDAHLVDLVELPGLVAFAECKEFVSDRVTAYLRKQFNNYTLEQYGELVLGCTHFNFFKDTFQTLMPPHVHIIDGSLGTVRQLMRVLNSKGLLSASQIKATQKESNDWETLKNNICVKYYTSGHLVTDPLQLNTIQHLHERLELMRKI